MLELVEMEELSWLWLDEMDSEISGGLDSDSSMSLRPEKLLPEELDCSDSSKGSKIFKDSNFFFKNFSFFSALFLSLISSFSLISISINCTHKKVHAKEHNKSSKNLKISPCLHEQNKGNINHKQKP